MTIRRHAIFESPHRAVVRMLKPGALSVRPLTGVLVRMSVVPGVIIARTFSRNEGGVEMRFARSFRFGAFPPTLAVEIQSRRPAASTDPSAE